MEYKGNLYGKVGKSYFKLLNTSEDFDKLKSERNEMLEMLKRLIQPDLDISDLIEAEQLIKKATRTMNATLIPQDTLTELKSLVKIIEDLDNFPMEMLSDQVIIYRETRLKINKIIKKL